MPIVYTAVEDIKAGDTCFVNGNGKLEKYNRTPTSEILAKSMEVTKDIPGKKYEHVIYGVRVCGSCGRAFPSIASKPVCGDCLRDYGPGV